ncbi:hypothetical protein GGI07_003713 [Coemansia sp. Benny D115]|nr:hypothetical protein GGI07_003713 [Coemansia sp. Benny D115]
MAFGIPVSDGSITYEVDIDWEYPGRKGNECNVVDAANDTPNFLIFLKDLRAAFDTAFGAGKKLITLAVRVEPFDVDGAPSKDVSEFAKYVDFANMMQYDINGGWNKETGPNAPMNFENGKGLQASFVSAIDAWTGAGWPANQLTAGIGFYGRSTIASVDMTKDPTNQYQPQQSVVPLGDSEDASWYDACAGSAANSGIWKWRNLRGGSVLSDPKTAVAPWVRQWDPVSQTPWLFNPSTKQFISYDDQESIKLKVDYAASKGLLGSMIWGVEMDYKEELLSVVKSWSVSAASNTASEKAAADGVGDGAGTSGSDAVATGAATDSAAADDDDDDDDVKCDDDNTAANATTAANTGNTAEDVSEFAKYVDFISLMQYDINGGWNTVTGPNAPFDYEQGKGLQASFVSAIDAWTGAGWPANQLVAGIAFYGRSTIASVDMTLDPTNQYQSQNSSVPLGDSDDAPWTDTCAGSTANGGLWKWGNLRSQGVLTDPKTAAEPWVRQWDPISQTPWLFNPSTKQFISYDDTESLKVKVDYAASKGLAGTMVWAMEMDYNDELLDVLLTFSGGAVDTDNNMASSIALPSASRDTAASTRKPVSLESISSKSIRPAIDQKAVVIGPADTEEQLGGDSQFVEEGQEEECTVEGDYKCADSEGQSPEYFFCAQKKWLSLSCASGTVCWLTSGVMSCGWPTTS